MSELLLSVLQCGAFVLIPLGILGFGMWLILRYIGMENQWAIYPFAFLIGLVFFAASVIGMLMDSASATLGVIAVLKTALLIGLGASIAVLSLTALYRAALRIRKL